MTQRPPRRPTAPPPLPELAAYRPFEERQGGAPPPIEQRFRPPGEPMPRGPKRSAPVRRQRSWLRIFAWTFGGLGVLTAAGLGALVMFAPVGVVRDQIVREVQVRTGRDLVIAGRTSLTLFPSLGITMGDVTLSSPRGMVGPDFVKMKQLDIRVPVLPLLSRKVSVERLVLSEPVFELRVDARGRRSWDFAELAGPATIMVAQAPSPKQGAAKSPADLPPELQDFLRNSTKPADADPASPPGARRAAIPDIALGDVSIENGTVRYRDERSGLSEEVRAINARLAGTTLASPIEAKGDLVLRGDKIDFDGRVGSPKALLEERASRVTLTVASARMTSRYDGSLSLAKTAQLEGNIRVETPSVRALADWLGARLQPGQGLGAFELEGDLKAGGTSVNVDNAKVRLDAISGTGNANIDMSGVRPFVKASLRLGAVDLNRYLVEGPVSQPARTVPAAGPAAAPRPATPGPATPSAGPQVKGFASRTGWSDAPIDLSAFALLDADVKLSLASLLYQDIRIGATQLSAVLKNRVLRATIDDIRLYDGQGRGLVTIEPSGAAAAISGNLTLTGVSGLPILKDAAGFDWVDGKARIQLALAGAGATERAIMEGLNGKADFAFADGAVIGYNVPQMIRGLSQGKIGGFSRNQAERTEFGEAGASFVITKGVAETKDLRVVGPIVRITGAGAVNLGQRQIDLVLRPKLGGAPSAQPGGLAAGDLSGLELPIRIKGSWERPQVAPDVDGLLKNPSQAVETIRDIGRQLQQGKTGGLNNLLEQFRRK